MEPMQSGDTEAARVRFTNRAWQNPINVVLGYRKHSARATIGAVAAGCRLFDHH